MSTEADTPVEPVPSCAARVVQAVREETEAYVEFLCRLARIETPSTDPASQAPALAMLADALGDAGLTSTHLPGRDTGGCLVARPADRDRGRPVQFLLGHVDTVWPHGTLAGMPVDDTVDASGRRVVRGPGTFDMKAGLTSIVFALRALDRVGVSLPASPVVLVSTDEEIGSHESRRHIERLARASTRVYVTEPALGLDGRIKTARKGTGEYVVHVIDDPDADPDAGRTSGRSEAGARGGSNGAQAASGNIVLELSRLVQRLYRLNDPERGVTVNVGTIDGQQAAPSAASPGAAGDDEAPVDAAPQGRLSIDVRVPTQDDAERVDAVIQAMEASTPGVRLSIRGGIERRPLERTPGNRRLWRHAQTLGAHVGLDLVEGRAGGASDGNFTSAFTPTLDGLGAVGDGAHATHEFVDVERTVDRCALLALLLLVPVDPDPASSASTSTAA